MSKEESPPEITVWYRKEFNLKAILVTAAVFFACGQSVANYEGTPDPPSSISHFKTDDDKWAIKLTYEGGTYYNTWKKRGAWVDHEGGAIFHGATLFIVDGCELNEAYDKLVAIRRGKDLVEASSKSK